MRVISGRAKGRKLRPVPGSDTRPITDRVKENLFNLIQWDVPGSRFLDLFAGTGSVGIEALSRGACEVVFLDTSRTAISVIHANLEHCQLAQSARVIRTDAFVFLSNDPDQPFDIVYVAPPQYQELWSKALRMLDGRPDWIADDGLAIVQIHPKEFRELHLENLEIIDQRTYGSTSLVFYSPIEENGSPDEF
jgi:16S rRNA (guanine(966)-N(2))-methyltransferase RsmD